jgi:hypothetical protein
VPSSPQAAAIPAKKKPRLEEPFSASTDEAAANISSPDTAVRLPAAAAAAAAVDHADADPVTDSQLNGGASTWATAYWAPEEDVKLTNAVANTFKKKWGNEYKIDWVAVAAQVPGRDEKPRWSRVERKSSVETNGVRTRKGMLE